MSVGTAARLREELDALDRAYARGSHGRWSARARADAFDRALTALYEVASPPGDVALLAVGGYGRRQQLPHSDVDVVMLHDGPEPAEVARVTDALLYPLWDSGLDVGHAVRTPVETTALAAGQLDVRTAMLDARVLAGDASLAVGVIEDVAVSVRADPRALARELQDDADSRRERYGSTTHLLEPNVKEGVGGLRDAQALGWLEHAVGGSLVESGLLRDTERNEADEAEEFLIRVRSALHLEAGRRLDRLDLPRQSELARDLGFVDEPGLPAVDGLMRSLFEHARALEHARSAAIERLLAEPGGAVPSSGDPAGVLRAVADVSERGETASVTMLDALAEASPPGEVEWTDEVRDGFLRVLRTGDSDALGTLDRIGLLERLMPAWADVRSRPQRDPYHRFTVDTHLLRTFEGVAAVLGGKPATGSDPEDGDLVTEAVSRIEDSDAVRLGALLHDIGKDGAGHHVPEGVRLAEEQLARMRLPVESHELAAFLVAEHLLLPDTATRRDLTDQDLLLDVAARIGTPERLAALFLLARADAAATGPAAWTPWRRALIRELVGKVQRAFDRGEMGAELAAELATRVNRVRELLEAEPDQAVDAFVLRMPRSYFLAIEPDRVARQFRTIAPPLGAVEVRTANAPGARAGASELLVVAGDRPGLLSWIAGALALAGLSILTAQVFTTEDGAAVDVFEVEGIFEAEISEERWRRFRTDLRRTIEGRISLDHRLDELRRRYEGSAAAGIPLSVSFDQAASEFSTVVEVGAADRIGLLHDVTAAFADLQVDVHLAKVATYGGRVVDAFYVRDALGRKIVEPERCAEIEQALRRRLEPSNPGQPATSSRG